MKKVVFRILISAFAVLVFHPAYGAEPSPAEAKQQKPTISISEGMDDAIVREASRVKEDLEKQARSLFERKPLEWNLDTIGYLTKWLLSLPQQLPELSPEHG